MPSNMSPSKQPERNAIQAFGFHQLRQACEISTLRQEIASVLTSTAGLQLMIENEVERMHQRVENLSADALLDATKLSPLLSDAMGAMLEIRDASRRLETTLARHDQPTPPPPTPRATQAPAPPPPRVAPAPASAPAAPPPPRVAPAPATQAAAPLVQPPRPTPPRTIASRTKVTNWLMPADH